MAKQSSGTGKGGKTYEERELASEVRNLALGEIKKILEKPKHRLYGAVIVKLAGSVLPRLNEHGGIGGGAIQIDNVSKQNAHQAIQEITGAGNLG